MSRQAKTETRIAAAVEVLQEHNPMTLRQVYYQLVSREVIENSRSTYTALGRALVLARQDGIIPWEWIEDRMRRPRIVSMWTGLASFAEIAVMAYRRNVWKTQPAYLECWVEKDALSGIFEELLLPYGVTLNVGRGYDGWSSIREASARLDCKATILYFGDFDPSGMDISRSLKERLAFFGQPPVVKRCALTLRDVRRYRLPPDFTKTTDTRSAAFVDKYGDLAVELDALPVDVLRRRITSEIEARMDLDALAKVRHGQESDRKRLRSALAGLGRTTRRHV